MSRLHATTGQILLVLCMPQAKIVLGFCLMGWGFFGFWGGVFLFLFLFGFFFKGVLKQGSCVLAELIELVGSHLFGVCESASISFTILLISSPNLVRSLITEHVLQFI